MTSPHMTSPHVSEQEVEAAARAMADLCETSVIEAPKLPWPCWMGAARSILTAAAQVRERAPDVESGAAMRLNFIADQVQSWLDWSRGSRAKENLTTDGDTAIMALPVPVWPKHGSLQNWVKALREGAMIVSLWQADRAKSTLMPIYGATEPDSGPDVLGEQKGEE